MILSERNPLPERCIKCEKEAEIYLSADIEKQIRMEHEGFNLDCSVCDYALDRFYFIESEGN